MPTLDDVRAGGAWSLSGLLFGLDSALDDEGRPLAERRAPSDVKQDVPMVLRACPYHDERKGQPMNVSALTQLTKHLDTALADVAAFQQLQPTERSWSAMFAAIIDQLAGPAYFYLRGAESNVRVPARVSVGYKLAAGFFDVLRKLIREQAMGRELSVDLESFLAFVEETRALIGASEVCAGPPNLIARSAKVFLGEYDESETAAEPWRLPVARALFAQILLGIVFELYDERIEREFFFDAKVETRNFFIAQRLEQRASQFAKIAPPLARPELLEPMLEAEHLAVVSELCWSMQDTWGAEPAPAACRAIEELIDHGEGSIIVGADARAGVARAMVGYLRVYRRFVGELVGLEREIRGHLGVPVDAPVSLNGLIRPGPRSLRWFEAALGHHLQSPDAPADLLLTSHRRRVELAPLL